MSCRSITQIIRQASSPSTLIEWTRTEIAPNEPPQAFQHLREHKRELVAFLRVKESESAHLPEPSRADLGAVRFRSGRQDGAGASRAVPVRVTRSRDR